MEAYSTSLQHVLGELERIDFLIRLLVSQARRIHQADEEFQGLYVSEQEVDALLAEPAGLPRWALDEGPLSLPKTRAALRELEETIAGRTAESLHQGITLRWVELGRLFDLSPFELDVLLIALAPEIDLRYERLFAYLQDDVTKKRPSVDLILNLLCPSLEDKLERRVVFSREAPLLRHRLVELFEDPSRPYPPLLAHYLRLDERVAAYVFGVDHLDPRLAPYARRLEPRARLDDLVQPAELRRRLEALSGGEEVAARRVVYLQGPYGVGKKATAAALCRAAGLGLLVLDLGGLLSVDAGELTTVLDLAGREAALSKAALYWQGFDLLLADDQEARRSQLLRRLEERDGLSFLAGETTWEPAEAFHGIDFLRFELPRPGHRERVELWSRALDGQPTAGEPDLDALATKFLFSGGQIEDAVATGRSLARRQASRNGHPSMDHLQAACRLQSNRKLIELAQKITPRYRWSDIVLPDDRLDQLREITNCVKYRARIYEEWGFGDKLSLGKGLNVLFTGPSGTGKTMAAEILAGELGLDLYKIDLSTVVSKYIGETEKNLSKIFGEAETSNAILFFDEADALFGKRSEVRDSHDRYANVEISYLLQKMEEYEGVAILATNLKKNMDDAFVRRMHFSVDFPFPDERSRRRIWEGIWPRDLPRSAEVDLGLMARRFEIAGGNIRNIAVAASFLAADDGEMVDMPHLMRATRREYQKMGKVMAAGKLGEPAKDGRYETR